MPTGYYLTKRQRKDSIMQTGIHSIHPSGIVLQVKPEQGDNASLQKTMHKILTIMTKLHDCDPDSLLKELVVFDVEYDEKDVIKTTDGHILLGLTAIPAEKVKYVGDFSDMNADNA